MRLLVTGASGLLGGRLAELLAGRAEVVCGRHLAPVPRGLPEVPFTLEPAALSRALDQARPHAVLHAAALASAEACERDPARAGRDNVEAPAALARLCRERGLLLVHLSTDLVFAGDRAPVAEDEPPRPLQAYGRSKAAGEAAVRAEHPGAAVLRVALVHGRGFGRRATATEAVAWALQGGRTVTLFTDEFRTAVDPESVAEAAWRVLAGGHAGTFHAGGPERLSRYELGLRVARTFGLDATLIRPARRAAPDTGAARPPDVSLDCRRTCAVLGWQPRPLAAGLSESRREPPGPQ